MSTTCRNCGLSLSVDDAFCGNCGQAAPVDKPTAAPAAPVWMPDGKDAAAPMPAVGDALASTGPPENDAQVGAAETARRPRTFSRKTDSVTEQGLGQGRPDDAGRADYEAQGQPQYSPGHGQGAGYPGQVTAGYPSPSQEGASSKGFVGSLFDFGFTSFVTPKVVRVLYPLIMILAGLGALGLAATAFSISVVVGILALIIFAPLYFLVVTAIWRIALEFFVVIFRVAEDIRAIRERGDFR